MPRPVLLSALLLLASCSVLQQQQPQKTPASTTPVVPKATEAESPTPAVVAATADQRTDNGLSRKGRVIQLGRQPEKAPAGQPPQNNVVSLNYEQEDLRNVIEQLGDALGINMVIDPTIDNKVSLRTSSTNPLRYEQIWPLLRMLARNAGVTIEQAGNNLWRFQRNASNIPAEVVLPGGLGQTNASEVMQVTPLTYVSVKTLEPILAQLLVPTGSVVHLGQANMIGIIGTPGQLARINQLLAVIDDDPFQNQGIQLYQLRSSPAAKVADELTNVLKLIEGPQSSYQVLGLERINSVVVLAPANRGFDEIDRWMNILDAESQEQSPQVFLYKVKNLKAKDMAESLTTAFTEKSSTATTAQTGNQQRPNNQIQGVQVGPQGQIGVQLAAQQPNQNPNQNPLQQLRNQLLGLGANADSGSSANLNITITPNEESNSLLIKATPREYRQLLTTINKIDAVPLQVQVNAVIGQVTLTEGTQFGVDWTRISASAQRISTQFLPGSFAGGGAAATGGSLVDPLFANPRQLPNVATGFVMSKAFTDGNTVINGVLQALAQENSVSLLARPTILATNNEEGKIHVGQSVPVSGGATQTAVGTTTNISYRDVGIELTIKPQINQEGYINLEISQKLSSVDSAATSVGNNPSFNSQELTTHAVVLDKSTIVLGGLIQEDKSDSKNGVPVLSKIPVLGRLFAYNQLANSRKELFVILRPQIVYGDSRDEATMAEIREKFIEVGKLLNKAGL